VKWTLDALRYNRTPATAKPDPIVPPLRSGRRSDAIDHVVFIAVQSPGYDAMFGDLADPAGEPHGNGDPSLETYPQSVTPNLHALAHAYALADNFYAADEDAGVATQVPLVGTVSLYAQLMAGVGAARNPATDFGDDPEEYTRAGTIFNALERAGLSYRDYGGMLHLSGESAAGYTLGVPALAALSGNADLMYSMQESRGDAARRAAEFASDMTRYVQADAEPNFVYVALPVPNRPSGMAETDRALGSIVDFISHTPHWSSTAIFVVPEGVIPSTDHVNDLRSYALVVSPLARRGYVGRAHLYPAGVLKTEEEIFGLEPLSLGDLLATDMADFFLDVPDPEPYDAIR